MKKKAVSSQPSAVSRRDRVAKMWEEAIAECKTVRAGTCASCSGQLTIYPYFRTDRGEMIPIHGPDFQAPGHGQITHVAVCPCCSFAACRHCWHHGVLVDGHTYVNGQCSRCGRKQVAA